MSKGCMIKKNEKDLPKGTTVYLSYGASYEQPYAWKYVVWESKFFYNINYIFNPEDGLWATKLVRKIWKDRPSQHPHCTLYNIIYKYLESSLSFS